MGIQYFSFPWKRCEDAHLALKRGISNTVVNSGAFVLI